MQVRSQQALVCIEDIINLKDYKIKIIKAVESKDLSLAVRHIKQVHEIEIKALQNSEDYSTILEKVG